MTNNEYDIFEGTQKGNEIKKWNNEWTLLYMKMTVDGQ